MVYGLKESLKYLEEIKKDISSRDRAELNKWMDVIISDVNDAKEALGDNDFKTCVRFLKDVKDGVNKVTRALDVVK